MKNRNVDKLKQRIAPGVWVDRNEALHFSIPELLTAFHLPNTKENRNMMADEIKKIVHSESPGTLLVEREDN